MHPGWIPTIDEAWLTYWLRDPETARRIMARRLMEPKSAYYATGPDGQLQLIAQQRGGTMNVSARIEELKTFNADRLSVEEMLFLSADAQRLRDAYEARAMPTPEWLGDQLRTLNVEIDRRKRDDMEKRLKELKVADAADMTASERREARRVERERIEKELAGAPSA